LPQTQTKTSKNYKYSLEGPKKQLVNHFVTVVTKNTHSALHRLSFQVHEAVGLA